MTKFLFLSTGSFSSCASVKRAFELVPGLIKTGHFARILLEDTAENRFLVEHKGLVEVCDYYKTSNLLGEIRKKYAAIYEMRPDVVVYCSIAFRHGFYVGLPRGTKICLNVDEIEHLRCRGIKRPLQHFLEVWAVFNASYLIAASRDIENWLDALCRKMGMRKKSAYISYSIERRFSPKQIAAYALKKRTSKTILYFGAITETYGCFFMLEALKQVFKSDPSVTAIFCGKGRDFDKFRNAIVSMGLERRILTLGFVDEETLWENIFNADVHLCFLSNSTVDRARCPSKLYMQIVTKRPVVCARIAEAAEILGDNGYYHEVNDSADMGRKINLALQCDEPINYELERHTAKVRVDAFLSLLSK